MELIKGKLETILQLLKRGFSSQEIVDILQID